MDISASYLRDLVELVSRWNVSPEQLLRGLPLSPSALLIPETRIPLAVVRAIVDRALVLTNEPALAIYLGMQMRLSSHGFLGFAAMTSHTIGDALALAVRYARTRTNLISLSQYTEGTTCALVFEDCAKLGEFRPFVVLTLAVALNQMAHALTGTAMLGHAECAFAAPQHLPSRFSSLLRFDCAVDRLVFPTSQLELRVVSADPIAAQLARSQCERELVSMVDAGTLGRVRSAVDEALNVGHPPALHTIAKSLRVSPRTLKRRLAQAGSTFTNVVSDVRRQRAILLLEDRTLSVGEVASRLGYADLPNFTRAFRRWTGQTPAAFRERIAK